MDGEKEVSGRDNDVVVMLNSLIVGWTFGHDCRWIYSESFFAGAWKISVAYRRNPSVLLSRLCINCIDVLCCCFVVLVLLVEKMSGSLALSQFVIFVPPFYSPALSFLWTLNF